MAAFCNQLFNAVQGGESDAGLALVIMPYGGITQWTTGARFGNGTAIGHLNMMASRAGELAHIMAVNSHFLQSIQVFSLQAPAAF